MKQEPVPRFVVRGHSTRCQALGTPTDPIRSTRKAHHPNPPPCTASYFSFTVQRQRLRSVWWGGGRQGGRGGDPIAAMWQSNRFKRRINWSRAPTSRKTKPKGSSMYNMMNCFLCRLVDCSAASGQLANWKLWQRSAKTEGDRWLTEWGCDWSGWLGRIGVGGGFRQAARKYSKLYQNLNFRFHYAAAACALLIDQLPLCFFIFFLPWLKSLLRQQGISLFNFDRRVFIQVMSCICGQEN